MKKRILVCVGTRADAIKTCPLYLELVRSGSFEVKLVNCGQHGEMTDAVLSYFSVRADYSLGIMKKAQDPHDTAVLARERLAPVLGEVRPDLVIVQGDTASSLGCAEAAADAHVCVAHVEAGLRTHDTLDPYPEEEFRVRISRIASVHFAPTERAAQDLVAEGVEREKIFVVGNTVTDALRAELEAPREACELVRSLNYAQGVMLLTCHRRENLAEADGESGAERIFRAVGRLLCEHPHLSVVFPIHKNERVRELYSRSSIASPRMIKCEPLDYPSTVYLLSRAALVLTDSGGICEEAVSLGTPTVIARNRTERPEALASGVSVLAGRDEERIFELCSRILRATPEPAARGFSDSVFGDGRVSPRIRKILEDIL